jgi:hypothetical protein
MSSGPLGEHEHDGEEPRNGALDHVHAHAQRTACGTSTEQRTRDQEPEQVAESRGSGEETERARGGEADAQPDQDADHHQQLPHADRGALDSLAHEISRRTLLTSRS